MSESSLRHTLESNGVKITRARSAILRVLSATSEHLTVAEVYRRVRRIDRRVGLASVYRTMELLARMGLVKHVHLDHRHRHYASITADHRHHLVCTSCGLAVEFNDCRLEALERVIARRTHFRIDGHCVEFFGQCRKCRTRPSTHASQEKNRA